MRADIDHVVLWVDDPLRSVNFYVSVVGLEGVRVAEYEAKQAPFPSVRLSERAMLDLGPKPMAEMLNGVARKRGVEGDAAGHRLNHLCLAMSKADYEALRERLVKAGIDTSFKMNDSFGARGKAPDAFYFVDPDGNVIEARYYDD